MHNKKKSRPETQCNLSQAMTEVPNADLECHSPYGSLSVVSEVSLTADRSSISLNDIKDNINTKCETGNSNKILVSRSKSMIPIYNKQKSSKQEKMTCYNDENGCDIDNNKEQTLDLENTQVEIGEL